MGYRILVLGLLLPIALFVAISWGQSGRPRADSLNLPTVSPEAKIEAQLRLMRNAEAGMGANHPQRAETRRRIAALEEELAGLTAVPNPFEDMKEQGVEPRDIVDRLSEKELRVLVVRLAVDVRDLRARVADLEQNRR
ncbi:MAG: hypothetical protein KDA45_01090 [Planctomycetales bacterium]|nr:hypothetical protein [Planctomycetales bacterium]